MNESITKELRRYVEGACEFTVWRTPFGYVDPKFVTRQGILAMLGRVDARFDRELTAKREEVDGLKADMSDLQARLDASILPPVDIDGARWTGEDVDKPFTLTDGDKATGGLVREIAYGWPRKGWFIVDQYDAHYPADRCRHGTLEPPDSQERIDADVKKDACDYFGRSTGWCHGCPAENGGDCATIKALDLLRRQRELDWAGEQS